MMLLEGASQRSPQQDFRLGATTALVAGFVNVCSVIAFFAFSSNVTGHVAIFAEETVKGHWHQVSVVLLWMLLFLTGAFAANLSVTAWGARWPWAGRLAPPVAQILLLTAVAFYGHGYYRETLKETEVLVGLLVFSMGLQNGLVASVSGGTVKTTHLTGLFTDLGMELSMVLQRRYRGDAGLRTKLRLHLGILSGYIVGGIAGGFAFLQLGFPALYLAGGVLGAIVIHDLIGLEARYPLWGRVAGGDPSRLRAVLAPVKAAGQASQAWGRHLAARASAQRNRHPGSRADRVEGKGRPRGSGGAKASLSAPG